MRKTLFTRVSFAAMVATLAGCSSTPPPTPVTHSGFKAAAMQFMTADPIRYQGTVVDKGQFYPKETFTLSYRYCAASPAQAEQEISAFYDLAKQTCTQNNGVMLNQEHDTWCVTHPSSTQETPLFAARITTSELWADICPTGPFVTMRVIENQDVEPAEWVAGATLLGYQPYSPHRKMVTQEKPDAEIFNEEESPAPEQEAWTEESGFIATHIGETVCMYKKTKDEAFGVTYKGTIHRVNNDRISVLATEKLKGDIRTAPEFERLPWYPEAIIEADIRSWFVCP